MATCVQISREPSIIPPKTFKLHLSAGEAQTLRVICDHISGDANKSRRGHMDAIGKALANAGADYCKLYTTTLHLKNEVGKVRE